jgi:tRNA-binding protein
MISWSDFEKVDMRVGTILTARNFEKARKPAIQLVIDFGPLGIKKSSAQITALYDPQELVGRQVIAVVNFPPKQIADFMSECLVLGIYNEQQQVVLLQPERPVANGDKIG